MTLTRRPGSPTSSTSSSISGPPRESMTSCRGHGPQLAPLSGSQADALAQSQPTSAVAREGRLRSRRRCNRQIGRQQKSKDGTARRVRRSGAERAMVLNFIRSARTSTNNPSPVRLHKFRRQASIPLSRALASHRWRHSNRTHVLPAEAPLLGTEMLRYLRPS
jgi:hypothetical protein